MRDLALLTLVILVVVWHMARREQEVWTTLPRHLDPAICHAGGCRWTPEHPEDCSCPEAAGA
jgi:hypothetical protein